MKPRHAIGILSALFAALVASCLLTGCPGGDSANSISGTYVASQEGESITLDFKSGNKVLMTNIDASGKKESTTGTWAINGNEITCQVGTIGSMPMGLTRNGNNLVGPMGMIFTRK